MWRVRHLYTSKTIRNFKTLIINNNIDFKENIDSFTAQKMATELWKSYDKLFYGNGRKVYYKKYGEFNSLEGMELLNKTYKKL